MITGVHHIGMSVHGLDPTIRAFSEGLPLTTARRFAIADEPVARTLLQLSNADAEVALLRGPNAYLELFDFGGPARQPGAERPVNAAGITHICIQGKDIDALRLSLEAGQMRFHAPPTDLGTGFLYAYGRDINGNIVETEGAPFAPSDPSAWLGHVAYATHDLDRLVGFYAALAEVPVIRGGRLRGDARYDSVTGLADVDVRVAWAPVRNLGLEFWQYLNPLTTPAPERPVSDPGYSHVCFESDDLDADRARAIRMGARPHGKAVDLGGSRVAYLRDPDGNALELIQWMPEALSLSVARLPHADILDRVRAARV
jgi:catechol 2,3-dioxygenase-like lactoylglutathione lyase family enzyme